MEIYEIDEIVRKWCKTNKCKVCNHELKQRGSYSLTVACTYCHCVYGLIIKEEIMKFLTVEKAIGLLSEGEYVHTFREAGGCLVGADMPRNKLIDTINKCKDTLTLADEQYRSMKHGIAIHDSYGWLFIETKL